MHSRTKIALLASIILLFAQLIHAQSKYWISTTPGNWNNAANWSTTQNGAGGAPVPGAGEVAIFNGFGGRNGSCTLDIAPTVGGITINSIYTGTLNLSGFSLTTTGTNVFATGSITNSGAAASLIINTTTATTFSGTSFSVPVTGSSGDLSFNGSVFNQAVTLTKTGASNNNSVGGDTFHAAFTITNAGSGELNMAFTNPDVFNGAVVINNIAAGRIQIGVNSAGNLFAAGSVVIIMSL